MPLTSSACHILSPRTFSRLYQHNFLSTRAFRIFSGQLHRMPKKPCRPDLHECNSKRQKIQSKLYSSLESFHTMTSKSGSHIQLELTEVEAKLRQLLLDVAAYIDNNPARENITNVQIPHDLAKEKTVLRWTGGWVRDKLLKVGSHDIDLAINKMTGEHFGLKIQEYLEIPGNAEKHGLVSKDDKTNAHAKSKKIAPGLHKIEANPEKSKNLETATTKIMGIELDLVNLRKETYNEVSRNPQMEFGTAEEDALRRDATVNAMFYNLHTCQVEDFTGRGHNDMAARIIRTPLEPTQTFKDDPLRVLRLIRFATRLDYSIDAETAKAMGDPEIQDVLKIKISRERVGIELEKMLRGPRPRMALEHIDGFGLYRTVFTDATRKLDFEPQVTYFKPAYDFIESVSSASNEIPQSITKTLLRDGEEKYLAWICATMMPWADAPTVPHPKPTQRPFFAAYLVAREGFKAPNRVCDVVVASLSNSEEIRDTVSQCAKALRRSSSVAPAQGSTARDTLGMALRRWGPTWRTQVLFNLTYEITLAQVSKEEILDSYSAFLTHITKLGILDVDTFRPLLKGTDLAKALNTKPGPWMKDALDVVMAWQLRHPESQDVAAAIEAVKASQHEHTDSELPSRLASHFVQLTIPPLFPQNKGNLNALEVSQQPTPWKDPGAAYALDLLNWSILVMDKREIEAQWRFLMPPLLKMIDDLDVGWKARGCELLKLLLENLRRPSAVEPSLVERRSPHFLYRTGYHDVFTSTLFPLFAYIPSLTPESESVMLLRQVFGCLNSLAHLIPVENDKSRARESHMDRMMREGVLAPLAHFPAPSTYPQLAALVMSHVSALQHQMGINSVKHLAHIIPLLSAILQEPFVLSDKALISCTLEALRAAMLNAWPRIPGYRGAIMMGVCLCWARCVEEEKVCSDGSVCEVEKELQETALLLDAIMQGAKDPLLREEWKQEKKGIMDSSAACVGLLDGGISPRG